MGELSGLPGEGAPLGDDDPDAGERWAARHVARNAQAAPDWVELRRDIEERRLGLVRRLRVHQAWLADRAALLRTLPAERIVDAARATSAYHARVEDEVRGAVAEMNAVAARHNLKVPLALQIPPLDIERLRDQAARSPR